jgi:hypothetical protein
MLIRMKNYKYTSFLIHNLFWRIFVCWWMSKLYCKKEYINGKNQQLYINDQIFVKLQMY